MATSTYGFTTIAETDGYSFHNLINGVTQSIEDKMPVRYVSSISALDAMSSSSLYPNGMLAVLTANNSGLYSGNIFVRRGNTWNLCTGFVEVLSTFQAALTSNVRTLPGTTYRDSATNSSGIFTSSAGNAETLIGGNTWTNISYPSGYSKPSFGYPLGYRLVPGGALLRGTIARSNGKAIPEGTTLCTVPSVARPSQIVYHSAQGGITAVGNLQCNPNGTVVLKSASIRTTSWYSLDGYFIPQN